uniref:Uncharacterized protein n=1 Tax=Ixodes ricinus TaxID=34613 RepID=A0A131Y874_IXORI
MPAYTTAATRADPRSMEETRTGLLRNHATINSPPSIAIAATTHSSTARRRNHITATPTNPLLIQPRTRTTTSRLHHRKTKKKKKMKRQKRILHNNGPQYLSRSTAHACSFECRTID